jgi:YggT family protein
MCGSRRAKPGFAGDCLGVASVKREHSRGLSLRFRRRETVLRPEIRLVGAADARVGLLADAVSTAQSFVDVFVAVYILLIFVYVLTSWIRLPYSLNRLQRFLYDVCEPYLRLFRRVLPPLGPIDLSPIVSVIVLVALDQIVVRLLDQLH